MPTLTYNIKAGSMAGVSAEYKNPHLRLSEIDPSRTFTLESYTGHNGQSRYGWENEIISKDDFGHITSGSSVFIGKEGSVLASSGYAFVPTEKKIKLKNFVDASAVIYKREGNKQTIHILFGKSKADKYHIVTSRVGELDHIEDDSHNHGVNLDEVGELEIELSHSTIQMDRVKVSSDKNISLDFYPVSNVRVEKVDPSADLSTVKIDEYSGTVHNPQGKEISIKYDLAPLVLISNGTVSYKDSIDPSVTLNLLELKNSNTNIVGIDKNNLSASLNIFIYPLSDVDVNGILYREGKRHTLPAGDYKITPASSSFAKSAKEKISNKDTSVFEDIKSEVIRRFSFNGLKPISWDSGDVYKTRPPSGEKRYIAEVVVDDPDRYIVLPLYLHRSVNIDKIGYRNSRSSIRQYYLHPAGVIKLKEKGRYVIEYSSLDTSKWDDDYATHLNALISSIEHTGADIKVYYGIEHSNSVEYLNTDNPILIGNNDE